jgi:hypothetical protein
MPEYFARVELHDADDDDYELLRKAMKEEGFSHCRKMKSGKLKKLPTGYFFAKLTETDVSEVAKGVKARADSTLCDSEIVVSKNGGSFSYLSELCTKA